MRIARTVKIGRLAPPPNSLRLLITVSSAAPENVLPGPRARWEADLLAGAVRSFNSHDLRDVVQYKVAAPPDASGRAALVGGATIGRPGVALTSASRRAAHGSS